jgi:hypothetical protein
MLCLHKSIVQNVWLLHFLKKNGELRLEVPSRLFPPGPKKNSLTDPLAFFTITTGMTSIRLISLAERGRKMKKNLKICLNCS